MGRAREGGVVAGSCPASSRDGVKIVEISKN